MAKTVKSPLVNAIAESIDSVVNCHGSEDRGSLLLSSLINEV